MLTLATGSQGSGKTTLINSLIGENEKVVIETDILNKIDLLTLGCKKNDVLFVNHPEFKLNSNNLDILISKLLSISNRDVNIYLEIDVDKSDFLIDYIEKGLIKVFSCVSGEFGYGHYDIGQLPTAQNPPPALEHIKKEAIYVYEGHNVFFLSNNCEEEMQYDLCAQKIQERISKLNKENHNLIKYTDFCWHIIPKKGFNDDSYFYGIHVFDENGNKVERPEDLNLQS